MDELRYQVDLLTAMNQKLMTKEFMYRTICETSTGAFLFFDLKRDTIQVIGNSKDYFDFSVENRNDILQIIELYEKCYELSLHDIFYLEKKGAEYEQKEFKKKNSQVWTEIEAYVMYDDSKKPVYKILRFKNITKTKIRNEELKYLAYYDSLTGLYNRNHFFQCASQLLARAKEQNDRVSILFIDIDNFRQINDGMGILTGDELVQVFGQFLKSFEKEDGSVIISHFSSDIYCMAIYDPRGTTSVEYIHDRIRERCNKPFLLTDNATVNVSVSVGVAEYPEASEDLLKLINFAEIVMFKAKKNGKNCIQYFDSVILQDFLRNIELENKIKSALIRNSFEVYYQPQFDAKNGMLRGVEALARMKDEDGQMVSPNVFIPIGERNGTIITIGAWIMEESVKTYATLCERYQRSFILSLNISALQFKNNSFITELLNILEKYEVSPEHIELELTESILVDDLFEIKEKMQTLRDYGVKISLDDFGTGYSSLSYLKGLPIDTLKIDKTFVDTVMQDPASKIIVESILNLTRQLGIETIAEGVETQAQLTYLQEVNCDYIQGFLLGKPLKTVELENLIIKML